MTTSVTDPRPDFEINALGTFNVLEAARQAGHDPIFIYSSTNKVYGGMEDAPATELATRYVLADYPDGVSETAVRFHSPYGVSKGSADQYVHDYARIYGLRSVVFRQSCLEGASIVQTSQGDIPIHDLHGAGQVWSLGDGNMFQRRSYEGSFSPPVDGRRLYHLKTAARVHDPRHRRSSVLYPRWLSSAGRHSVWWAGGGRTPGALGTAV